MSKQKETSKEYCKHTFTEDEKREISTELAHCVSELSQKEDEKKAIMSDLKSQIDSLASRTNGLATKLNNGYEMRNIECEIERDYDAHVIRFFRLDTGELVRTRKMTSDDVEGTLPL